MSDIGSSSNPQMVPPARGTGFPAWARKAGASLRDPRARHWILFSLPLLFAVVFMAVIAWYIARPNSTHPFRKTQVTGNAAPSLIPFSNKPKPSPARPFQPTPPPAPSAYLPLPSPAVQPQQPSGDLQVPGRAMPGTVAPAPIPGATPTPAAPTAVRPQVSAITYHARHDKTFGGGCEGQLVLNSGGLVFDCPGDPRNSFKISLAEIGAIDDNGVRLLSGKKYHFSIRGMSKSGEESIFASWLHQVR